MVLIKNFKRFCIFIICAVTLLCTGFLAFNINGGKNEVYALTENNTSSSVLNIGTLTADNYASKTNKFDTDKLNQLYKVITGTASYDSLASAFNNSSNYKTIFGSKVIQGTKIYANAGNKDVVVSLGGFNWVVASATVDNNGDYVATLLQKDTSSYYVQWNKWSSTNGSIEAPSNLYSTSYIRNYALGIEGSCGYYASITDVARAQGKSPTYQVFTKNKSSYSSSLREFLDTPSLIKYQEQQSLAQNWSSLTFPNCVNEAYATISGNWNNIDSTYQTKPFYGEWKTDPIWIPSYTEVGAFHIAGTIPATGIWGLTNNAYKVSKTAWTRSGMQNDALSAVPTFANNAYFDDAYKAMNSHCQVDLTSFAGMRPAIHLNLTKANASKATPIEINDQPYVYNASTRLFTSLPFYDANKMTIVPKTAGQNNTDVGEYIGVVTLKEGYYVAGQTDETLKTKEVKIIITPQPIATPQSLSVQYTDINASYKIEDIVETDPTKAPWYNASRMTLDYGENPDPKTEGSYAIKVKLTANANGKINYYFEGYDTSQVEVTITLSIIGKVINPKGFTFVYDGNIHGEDDIKNQSWYTDCEENIERIDYNGDWQNVGQHEFTIVLKNKNAVSFEGEAGGKESKTFYVTITKKSFSIQALQIGSDGTLASPIALAPSSSLCGTDIIGNLQFKLQYQAQGSSVWSDTIPTAAGTHKVKVVLVTDGNYELTEDSNTKAIWTKAKNLVEVPFVALANNTNTKITSVKYSGAEQIFILSNLTDDVVISSCSNNLIYDNVNKTFKATNFGNYSITVSLKDNGLGTKWKEGNEEVTRTLNFAIEKAELEVSVDNSVTSWAAGERSDFTLTVNNVKDKDEQDITFTIYYTKNGGSKVECQRERTYSNGTFTITLDVGEFSQGNYSLYVELTDALANANYTIKNNSAKVAEFLVTASMINDVEIEWLYSNLLIGNNISASKGYNIVSGNGVCTPFNVEYNGQEYAIKLNELKIPQGITVTYSNEKATNSGTFTTTANFTVEEGYEISVPANYTIEWKVNPKAFDLGTLDWDKQFEYNGTSREPSLKNLESWMTSIKVSQSQITAPVGHYVVRYELNSTNSNYEFVNTNNRDYITISSKTKAYINLDFDVTLAQINISQENTDWVSQTREATETLREFVYYIPKIATDEGGHKAKLNVIFYQASDDTTSTLIGDVEAIKAMVIPDGIKLFYVRVTLKDEYKDRYVLYNTSKDGADFATYEFYVGDNRPPLEVVYNYDEQLGTEWTGQGIEVTVTPSVALEGIEFNITYAKQGASGETPLPAGELPVEVGTYRVFVTDKGGIYNITNRNFYLKITPLKVHIDGWVLQGGIKPPKPTLHANIGVNGDWFKYEITDKNGNIVDGDLNYNSSYSIKLIVADSAKDFINIENEDACEYNFKTEINSEALENLGVPKFEQNEIEWTGEEIEFVLRNAEKILENVDILGDLAKTEIGEYSILLTIKDGANAIFEGGLNEWTLKFKIVKKVLLRPNADDIGEIVYTGSEINVLEKAFGENWEDILNFVNVLSGDGLDDFKQTNAGKYTLRLRIKDEISTKVVWESALVKALADDEVEVSWEIKKAQIVGTWDNSNGYPVIQLKDNEQSSLFEIKYKDKLGNQILPQNLIDSEKYTYELTLKNNNYEFKIDGKVLTESEQTGEFTFKKQQSFINNALNVLKNNWLYFVIAIVILILLILIIVLATKKRKKENKSNSENAQYPNMQYNGYVGPQVIGQVPPTIQVVPTSIMPTIATSQLATDKERLQDLEIQQLREMVTKMARYQIASDEEKSKSEKLAKTEKMLMQFILNEFANNPDWVPFTNQDMIDYDINDLMNLYLKAKQIKTQKLATTNNSNEQNLLKQESLNFENKVAEYNKQKEDSKYEELLKAIREVSDAQKELKSSQEELKSSQKKLEEKVNNTEPQNSNKPNQSEKLDFDEAFENLPANQKRYFGELKSYALNQPNAKPKSAKQHFSVGSGNNIYVKFIIKYSTLIAVFGTTEVKLENDNSIEVAKQMIDTRVKKFQEKI